MAARPSPAYDGRVESRPGTPSGTPFPPGTHPLDLGAGAEAVLAVPDGDPAPRPLLLFCHGAGGSAADSLGRIGVPALAHDVLVLAPTSGMYTWDLLTGSLGRDVALLDAALEQVYDRHQVTRTAIGGFSDGGSYALSIGLANGDLFGAVLAFSPGFVAAPGVRGRPRIWVSHGTADRVLPVDRCGRRVVGELGAAGYDLHYDEFDGGHEVPPRSVTGALEWWSAG
jgi:phospholipase/carboxylesterase